MFVLYFNIHNADHNSDLGLTGKTTITQILVATVLYSIYSIIIAPPVY